MLPFCFLLQFNLFNPLSHSVTAESLIYVNPRATGPVTDLRPVGRYPRLVIQHQERKRTDSSCKETAFGYWGQTERNRPDASLTSVLPERGHDSK